jgi:hypothetical protein
VKRIMLNILRVIKVYFFQFDYDHGVLSINSNLKSKIGLLTATPKPAERLGRGGSP